MRRNRDTGDRHYRISSTSEVVVPIKGRDYRVDDVQLDKVSSRLGFLSSLNGKYYHPVDVPSDPIKALHLNGYSTPHEVSEANAAEMARLGIATGVYDVRKLINLADLRFPLNSAIHGGQTMLDIMEDISGESETAVLGHSTGGLTAGHLAMADGRVDYYVGKGIVGIQHHNMAANYIKRGGKVVRGVALPLIADILRRRDGVKVGYEYAMRSVYNPTLLGRQALMLANGPDIAPIFSALDAIGVPRAVFQYENDEFFDMQTQLDIIATKPDLFDIVEVVPDTGHMHPCFSPIEDAKMTAETLYKLRGIKKNSQAVDSRQP